MVEELVEHRTGVRLVRVHAPDPLHHVLRVVELEPVVRELRDHRRLDLLPREEVEVHVIEPGVVHDGLDAREPAADAVVLVLREQEGYNLLDVLAQAPRELDR